MAARMKPQYALPTTIDGVIEALDEIIARSVRERSRLGYFAALYRKVTIKVKEGVATGRFQDGPRMERLDVTFANRYLEAMEQYRRGERPTMCWLVAFEAAKRWRPLVIQQLLLGMNAHINFDLGVAAATVCPGAELAPLKHDFDEINVILAGLVNQVMDGINEVSPWIKFLDFISKRVDDVIINFSMERARSAAWEVATALAPLDQSGWGPELDKLDFKVTLLGNLVAHPIGFFINTGLLVIRLRESNDIPKVIGVLNQTSTAGV
jgi:hypothetical protein